MQTFISKYGLAAHLALLAVTPLFLYPFFTAATIAQVLVWLSLTGLIWLVMEPSRRSNERLHEARLRVRKAIVRDPVFWLLAVLIAIAGIRGLNGGIVRIYDSVARKWFLDGPTMTLFPGHVDGEGFLPFATILALTVILLGCRQALGKSARIALVSMIGLFAGTAALVTLVACRSEHVGASLMAGFVDGDWSLKVDSALLVSSPGTAFGIALLGSVVAAAGLFECKWNKLMLLFSLAIGGTLTGLFYFATPIVCATYLVLALAVMLGCAFYLLVTMRKSAVLRFGVTVVVAVVIPFLMAVCLIPGELTTARGAAFAQLSDLPGCLFPEGFAARRAELSLLSADFWQESPWLGRGIGVFPQLLWLKGAVAHGLSSSGPLNGYWFLLVERGLLGVVMFVLPIGFMLFTYIHRLILARGRHAFLPLCALGLVVVASLAGLTLVDCSFLRPDVLLIGGAFLSLSASSFPIPHKVETEEDGVS